MIKYKFYIVVCLFLGTLTRTTANIQIPKVLSSNMVLQRNIPVPVWGKADALEKISVEFAGQILNTVADTSGHWQVTLKPLKASQTPAEMVITGKDTLKLENILVGDVWICTGQSNMEYPLDRSLKKYLTPARGEDIQQKELTALKSDQIRYLYAERQTDKNDLKSIGWITPANDSVLRKVSAVGYFFAKEIHAEINIPIGIISTTWGGTRIEEWTPPTAYLNSQVFRNSISANEQFKIDGMIPGEKFQSMFSPIIPFAAKGMLWYQGESNCMIEDQETYPDKMRLLVDTYRQLLNNLTMPVYYVQIAPFLYSHNNRDKKKHTVEQLAFFREAQTRCLQIPNTGMIVTTDLVDNAKNIHPPYKWIVAHRLALLALNKTYHQKVLSSGPGYKSFKTVRNKIIVTFENTGSGLTTNDGQALNWFTVLDSDGRSVAAKAEIKGKNKIVVWTDEVKHPVAVRFAWNESAIPNLINKEGLPAIPFRTDK